MSTPKRKAKSRVKNAPARKLKVTKTKKVAKEAPAKVEKPKKVAPKAKKVAPKAKKVAPKAKKVAEKMESPPKAVAEVERIELGPPPVAVISARHVDLSMRERVARGFSFGELASAGVPLNAAKHEGLSLDIRRRSVVEGNVDMLKGWFKRPKAPVAVAAVSKK
jgi:ribosomal protein L13E